MRLLILSASAGNGHISAARALLAVAESRGHRVAAHDVLDHTGRAFRSWYGGGYEMLVRRWPRLWGHFYRVSDADRFTFKFQSVLDVRFCRPIERLIAESRPDWVVCTHSLPQPQLERMRERYGFRVAVVVTDLHPHLMWLRGAPDWYFVPTPMSRETLLQRLATAAERCEITGIPVHPVFRPADGPSDEPRLLVTAGGIGAGPLADVARAVAELPARVTVVAGRNRRALARLRALGLPPRVEIAGHIPIEEMARRMRSAWLVVGKPGGLTTFETLACGVPMVIYRPLVIPGQEEDNLRYLESNGAGVSVGDPDTLRSTLRELLADRSRLEGLRAAARAHGRPDAALTIVKRLETRIPALPLGSSAGRC